MITSLSITTLTFTSVLSILFIYFKFTDHPILHQINLPVAPAWIRAKELNSQSDSVHTETKGQSDHIDKELKEPEELEQQPRSQPLLSAMIDAPIVLQKPELYNGCEISTLTMLLQFANIDVDKMQLADEMLLDPTPLQMSKSGSIQTWGNPYKGFVGDITGKQKGYGIYHSALFELLVQYIPESIDFTGGTFAELEQHVAKGVPVIVWSTVSYRPPAEHQWMEWKTEEGETIRASFQEHTVLLVGYDETHVYIHDPNRNEKRIKTSKESFIESWEAFGRQAISYEIAEPN